MYGFYVSRFKLLVDITQPFSQVWLQVLWAPGRRPICVSGMVFFCGDGAGKFLQMIRMNTVELYIWKSIVIFPLGRAYLATPFTVAILI